MNQLAMILIWVAGFAAVAAMVPHQVRMIRYLSLIAGLAALAYFGLQALDNGPGLPLLFAAAFVLINAARLAELYRRARGGDMTAEERELFDHVMKIEDPAKQNRLKDLMIWQDVAPGEILIMQDQVEPPLIYIASGRAAIERDGKLVSECGAGEFVGEMSQISGELASATVRVAEPMRMARLDRDALAQLTRSLPEIGRAVDSAFNRSLAVKVMRMNQATGGPKFDPITGEQTSG